MPDRAHHVTARARLDRDELAAWLMQVTQRIDRAVARGARARSELLAHLRAGLDGTTAGLARLAQLPGGSGGPRGRPAPARAHRRLRAIFAGEAAPVEDVEDDEVTHGVQVVDPRDAAFLRADGP